MTTELKKEEVQVPETQPVASGTGIVTEPVENKIQPFGPELEPKISAEVAEVGVKVTHEENDLKPVHEAALDVGGEAVGISPRAEQIEDRVAQGNLDAFATLAAKEVQHNPNSGKADNALSEERDNVLVKFADFVNRKLLGGKKAA